VKPNFLLIGPDKAGSTWLYEFLKWHPQTFVPDVKELFFFDRYWHRGPAWYLRQFAGAEPHHLVRADISHDYLYSKAAPHRVRQFLGAPDCLVVVRDPAARAYSAYRYMQKQGRVSMKLSFAEAVAAVPELLDHGRYDRHVPRWESAGLRVRLVDFDLLASDPPRFAAEILEPYRVDVPTLPPELVEQVLPAQVPRRPLVAATAWRMGRFARSMRLERLVSAAKTDPRLKRWLYREPAQRSLADEDVALRATLLSNEFTVTREFVRERLVDVAW
jgi:hypothetical protein